VNLCPPHHPPRSAVRMIGAVRSRAASAFASLVTLSNRNLIHTMVINSSQRRTCATMLTLTSHYSATNAKHPRYAPWSRGPWARAGARAVQGARAARGGAGARRPRGARARQPRQRHIVVTGPGHPAGWEPDKHGSRSHPMPSMRCVSHRPAYWVPIGGGGTQTPPRGGGGTRTPASGGGGVPQETGERHWSW